MIFNSSICLQEIKELTDKFILNDTVIILGKGPTHVFGLHAARKLKCECWGINNQNFPEITLLFDMHEQDEEYRKINDHTDSIIPVMTLRKYEHIPLSVEYPIDDLVQMLEMDYFNNGIAYMCAFAIYCNKFKHILMAGVDYPRLERSEAEFERPCTEFWLGYAKGRKMTVQTTTGSNLFTFVEGINTRYGYDRTFKPADFTVKVIDIVKDNLKGLQTTANINLENENL